MEWAVVSSVTAVPCVSEAAAIEKARAKVRLEGGTRLVVRIVGAVTMPPCEPVYTRLGESC